MRNTYFISLLHLMMVYRLIFTFNINDLLQRIRTDEDYIEPSTAGTATSSPANKTASPTNKIFATLWQPPSKRQRN